MRLAVFGSPKKGSVHFASDAMSRPQPVTLCFTFALVNACQM